MESGLMGTQSQQCPRRHFPSCSCNAQQHKITTMIKNRLHVQCHSMKETMNPGLSTALSHCSVLAASLPPFHWSGPAIPKSQQLAAAALRLLSLAAAFPESMMTFKSFQARSPVSSKAQLRVIFISRNYFSHVRMQQKNNSYSIYHSQRYQN